MSIANSARRVRESTGSSAPQPHNSVAAYAALACVCIVWGTTYLGIRISVEALPPFYLIAIRYTISGGILLLVSGFSGARLPRGKELMQTAICGIICVGVGNGALASAETWVPSGLTALIYTTCPFWMTGIDALLPGGRAPRAPTVWGLLVGITGVMILVAPAAIREGLGGRSIAGFLVIQLSVIGWVTGALLQKRVKTQASPVVAGAVQQLAAGLAMFVPGALFEKLPPSIPLRNTLAVAYLIVFGSFVGYSCFVYAMSRLSAALVSIYTFVNPLVAVGLGWLFFREPFGWRELAALLVIFTGVFLVQRSEASVAR